jgi:K+ transporter
MASKLNIIKQSISKLNIERKLWLALSGLVVASSFVLFLGWNLIQIHHLQWVFVTLGITVSMIWWFWTMRLIRIILNHRLTEVEILQEIVSDIRDIKDNVANLKK